MTVAKIRSSFEGEWTQFSLHLLHVLQNCPSFFFFIIQGVSSAAYSPSDKMNRHLLRKIVEMGEKVDRIDINIAKLVQFYEEHHIESLTKEDALAGFPLDNYQEWLNCQAFLSSPKEMDKIVIASVLNGFINPNTLNIQRWRDWQLLVGVTLVTQCAACGRKLWGWNLPQSWPGRVKRARFQWSDPTSTN